MDSLRSNHYVFIVLVIVVIGVIYGKDFIDKIKSENLREYIWGFRYVIIAGVLALGSFILINWYNKMAADDTQEEINNLVEQAVDSIQNQVATTVNELRDSVLTQIKDRTDSIMLDLENQKQSISSTTKGLSNLLENRDILVMVEYIFKNTVENVDATSQEFYDQMFNELTNGNSYELKLKSDGKKAAFGSMNNFFQLFYEELHSEFGTIDETYANAKLSGDSKWAFNPQVIRVNYSMEFQSLGFSLKELKVGDKIQFVLRKTHIAGLEDKSSLFYRRKQSRDYFRNSFLNFNKHAGVLPQGSIKIKLMTRDGTIYECKNIQTNTLSSLDPDYGIYTEQSIEKIIKPQE